MQEPVQAIDDVPPRARIGTGGCSDACLVNSTSAWAVVLDHLLEIDPILLR